MSFPSPDPPAPDGTELLVRRAKARDRDAIADLCVRYRERLRVALRRMLGPEYRALLLDSEDAVQDAIVGAIGSLDGFEYRGEGSFLAWVLRIAEREMLMRLRARRTQKRDGAREQRLGTEDEPAAGGASPSEFAVGAETEARIRICLERLAPREREVLQLRRYLDLAHAEIAEAMALPSEGAARALLSRAQARLAALLETEPER
jgi:RNA polymerase sigma-70 factor (ECF subfamily)